MTKQDAELLELVKKLTDRVDALEVEIKELRVLNAEVPEETLVAIAAAVADAVLRAVSQRLAPRLVVKPGSSGEQLLEVQGMNLERYAALGRLLEPFGARLQSVDADRALYRVNGSAEQLRSQLSLAKLQEVPAGEAPAPSVPVQPVAQGSAPAVAPPPAPVPQLRFRW